MRYPVDCGDDAVLFTMNMATIYSSWNNWSVDVVVLLSCSILRRSWETSICTYLRIVPYHAYAQCESVLMWC